jgi:16S rRNA (cytosine1402-N4)-methyltransferase
MNSESRVVSGKSSVVSQHIPVLLKEVVDSLELKPGSVVVDGTLGGAGHSERILEKFPGIKLIGLDRDSEAVERAEEKLRAYTNIHLYTESYRNLDKVLAELNMTVIDALLLDLGISSDQLENSGRGFTFLHDEPLLMTMKREVAEGDLTAEIVVNTFPEESLELILRGFGEERYSRRIARAIVEKRAEKPIRTTHDLVGIVEAATPTIYHHGGIHPATRTFQALRIAVNEELTALEEGLVKGFNYLSQGGRMLVISFHSLEDRLVKTYFRDRAIDGSARLITKKPIVPSEEEIEKNTRSRSAKLRIIEKI